VAAAASIVVKRAHPSEHFDIPADFVWHGRKTLFKYADRASGPLPRFDAPRQDPLLNHIIGSLPPVRSD